MNRIESLHWKQDITVMNMEQFQTALTQLVQQPATGLILNLQQVAYLNSAAIGAIMRAYIEAQKLGKQLVVAGIEANVEQIFKIVKMDRLLPVFKLPEEALSYLEAGPSTSS